MSHKTDSFRFQRNSSQNSSGSSTRSTGKEKCRKRLEYKVDQCSGGSVDCSTLQESPETSKTSNDRTVLSVLNLNDTRRYIRNGAERLSRSFKNIRVTLGTLSQHFKTSTKRRQVLEEGPMTPMHNNQTPYTSSRQVLGRTPTKLYSPFSIDSPYHPTTTQNQENIPVSSI